MRAFREAMERGRAKGGISVRRMQMKLLEEGNATMGVWLGKQVLGQKEQQANHSFDGASFPQLNVVMPTVTLGSFTPQGPSNGPGLPDRSNQEPDSTLPSGRNRE